MEILLTVISLLGVCVVPAVCFTVALVVTVAVGTIPALIEHEKVRRYYIEKRKREREEWLVEREIQDRRWKKKQDAWKAAMEKSREA